MTLGDTSSKYRSCSAWSAAMSREDWEAEEGASYMSQGGDRAYCVTIQRRLSDGAENIVTHTMISSSDCSETENGVYCDICFSESSCYADAENSCDGVVVDWSFISPSNHSYNCTDEKPDDNLCSDESSCYENAVNSCDGTLSGWSYTDPSSYSYNCEEGETDPCYDPFNTGDVPSECLTPDPDPTDPDTSNPDPTDPDTSNPDPTDPEGFDDSKIISAINDQTTVITSGFNDVLGALDSQSDLLQTGFNTLADELSKQTSELTLINGELDKQTALLDETTDILGDGFEMLEGYLDGLLYDSNHINSGIQQINDKLNLSKDFGLTPKESGLDRFFSEDSIAELNATIEKSKGNLTDFISNYKSQILSGLSLNEGRVGFNNDNHTITINGKNFRLPTYDDIFSDTFNLISSVLLLVAYLVAFAILFKD